MDLLFVGTGAADYETVFKCACANCATNRARCAQNLRHYSSLLLNGKLLIDCGPTVPWRLAELDVPPAQIEAIVFTHSHDDHLDAEAVASLLVARGEGRGALAVYGNAAAMAALEGLDGLERQEVPAGESIFTCGVALTAVRANHIPDQEQTLNWLISDGCSRLVYATDTAWPMADTWQALLAFHPTAVVAEATFGLLGPDDHGDCLTHHLNWPEFLRLREELIAASAILAETPFIATHLSQHLLPPHEEFCQNAVPPVAVAYDGLSLSL